MAMENAAARRVYELLHKDRPFHDGRFRNWSAEPTIFAPYHFMDGVTVWVAETDVNPADDFLTNPDAQPERR